MDPMTMLTRRTALFATAGSLAAAGLRSRSALAQAASPAAPLAGPGPFTLPPLPYGFDANEPHIDAQTMMIHHDRHHAAYVANLNAALKDHGQVAAMPLETMLAKLHELPEALRTTVRNNGGGHANHSMFWTIMGGKGAADGKTGPAGDLAAAITRDLGGQEQMQTAFNRAGAGQFGSGWVFVTVSRQGKLAILSKPNQDTPLMDGGRILMGNDVWEHAYYLKYQNRRPDYLAAWWNVLDWSKINARYEAAKAGTLTI
jgi:Fe-Mn family superoxide dismutase